MNAGTESKRVVLCADDFGMNAAIDEGIVRLAAQGRLSAASCLTLGPTFAANAADLARTGAQTGLHLNFTEQLSGESSTQGKSSDETRQLYLPLPDLIRRAYLRRLNGDIVREQILRQLDSFETVFGRTPHFVDGHQHIHQLPGIRQVLVDVLAQRYRGRVRPWLRGTRAAPLQGVAAAHRNKARVIQTLGAGALARRARKAGFCLNSRFAGVYDFQGGEAVYRALLAAWLQHVGDGDVLMCHPAAHIDHADALGAQRVAEFNVLSSDDAGLWLQQYNIQPWRLPFQPGET